MQINTLSMVSQIILAQAETAPKLEIEGTPKVEDLNQPGSDGSPKLAVTLNFKQPIPAGFTKAKMEVCTNRCWPGDSAIDVKPGSKSVTMKAWFNHSVKQENGEYASIKINNPTTKQTLEFKVDVTIPGDF